MEPHDEDERVRDLGIIARRGEEIGRFLDSDSVKVALARTRAGIYDDWTQGATTALRENAFYEMKALKRLLDEFQQIQSDGLMAQEAIRHSDGQG